MARIPISWIILLMCLAVFGFFTYHILQVSGAETVKETYHPPYSPPEQVRHESSRHVANVYNAEETVDEEQGPAPVVPKTLPARPMPRVPGQTEEDLRAPEPLQETPPSVQYDIPEATDAMNKDVFMSAGFGSNLRHPEQMIESHPSAGMGQVVQSGIGSERSSPGGNRATGYSPEMIQNAGEFMSGVNAFDMSEMGSAFSMI